MKSIFQYSSGRKYLKDYYDFRKQQKGGYSYERFSKSAQMLSSNYLKLIMDGQRNLSIEGIHKFIFALKLRHHEAVYFETLVLFEQTEEARVRSYYSKKLRDLKKQFSGDTFKVRESSLLSEWYYPAIIVAVDGLHIDSAADILKTKLGFSFVQISNLLKQFCDLKIVSVKDDHYHVSHAHMVHSDRRSREIAQRKYLQAHLEKNLKYFTKLYGDGRGRFLSHTFTINKGSWEHYSDQIYAFIEQLAGESNKESPDQVVQLNCQLLPFEDLGRL